MIDKDPYNGIVRITHTCATIRDDNGLKAFSNEPIQEHPNCAFTSNRVP